MKQEFFNARLLQIQLEMEAVKAEIAGMQSRNDFQRLNQRDPTWSNQDFQDAASALRSLQGDIKALMEEYSKGEEAPAAGVFTPTSMFPDQFTVKVMVGDGTVPNSIDLYIKSGVGIIRKAMRFNKDQSQYEITPKEATELLAEWYGGGKKERLYTLAEIKHTFEQTSHENDVDAAWELLSDHLPKGKLEGAGE